MAFVNLTREALTVEDGGGSTSAKVSFSPLARNSALYFSRALRLLERYPMTAMPSRMLATTTSSTNTLRGLLISSRLPTVAIPTQEQTPFQNKSSKTAEPGIQSALRKFLYRSCNFPGKGFD